MVHISEAASLALHSMILIAKNPDNPVSVKRIAAVTGASEAHLAKVMQLLARAGMVASTRGPKGGFTLNGNPKDTTLLDIYEAIEGPVKGGHCLLHKDKCPMGLKQCALGNLIEGTAANSRDYLSGISLDSLSH